MTFLITRDKDNVSRRPSGRLPSMCYLLLFLPSMVFIHVTKGACSFYGLIRPNLPGIPLFPVISPLKGRVDIVRHVLAREIE
jgi:hypothetical protein